MLDAVINGNGTMAQNMTDLANGLRAFYDDVIIGGTANGYPVTVVVMSEFGRTWNRTGGTDHWPTTSVIFAGGNSFLSPNRMVGGFATNQNVGAGFPGYVGQNIAMNSEDGRPMGTGRPPP